MHSCPYTKQQSDDACTENIERAASSRVRLPMNDVASISKEIEKPIHDNLVHPAGSVAGGAVNQNVISR